MTPQAGPTFASRGARPANIARGPSVCTSWRRRWRVEGAEGEEGEVERREDCRRVLRTSKGLVSVAAICARGTTPLAGPPRRRGNRRTETQTHHSTSSTTDETDHKLPAPSRPSLLLNSRLCLPHPPPTRQSPLDHLISRPINPRERHVPPKRRSQALPSVRPPQIANDRGQREWGGRRVGLEARAEEFERREEGRDECAAQCARYERDSTDVALP